MCAALIVSVALNRVEDKLAGRDFEKNVVLDVADQVQVRCIGPHMFWMVSDWVCALSVS